LQAQISYSFPFFDVLTRKNVGILGCIAKKQTKIGYISGGYLEKKSAKTGRFFAGNEEGG